MEQVYTITCALIDISNTLVDNKFFVEMQRNVNVSRILLINTSQRYIRIGPEELATHWNIGLEIANKIIEVTTQRGIQTVANPILSRRFCANDRKLRYWRLNTNIFTNTLFYSLKFKQGNTCALIYCNGLNWTRIHPMESKSEAHHSLYTVFA